jgi:hypothetical protein
MATGGSGLDRDPTALKGLLRKISRLQVKLIVAQGAFVGVDIMRAVNNAIMPCILIHDHKVFLSRRA